MKTKILFFINIILALVNIAAGAVFNEATFYFLAVFTFCIAGLCYMMDLSK